MISRCILISAVVVAVFVALSRPAMAQYGSVYQGRSDNPVGPTVSPYLNLLQNNNPLTSIPNYQSLVRPLVDQQNAIQRQGNSIQQLQQQVSTGAGRGAGQRGTGHASFFMNYSHFYSPPRSQR